MKRLRYFARIAQDGSLTKAAGVLAIAQPALSRQMRVLESELGAALFSRTARGMRLTDEGEYLLAAISGPLRELDLAFQNIRAASTAVKGDFAIGMPSGVSDAIGSDLAFRMHSRHPDMRLKLIEGVTGSLLDWLTRGMIDFAILETAPGDDRFDEAILASEPLVLIGPPLHGEAMEGSIGVRAALRLPLILPSHHLGIKSIINAAAAVVRMPLVAHCETDSPRLALNLVGRGMGYTILPDLFLPIEVRTGSAFTRQLIEPLLPFKLYICSRKRSRSARSRGEDLLVASVSELIENRGVCV